VYPAAGTKRTAKRKEGRKSGKGRRNDRRCCLYHKGTAKKKRFETLTDGQKQRFAIDALQPNFFFFCSRQVPTGRPSRGLAQD
jgi:hypothetical protein